MRKRTGKIIKCKTCNNTFYAKPFRVKTQKYCSLKCRPPIWNKGLTKKDPRVLSYVLKVALAHKEKRFSFLTEFKTGDKRISKENHWNWKGGVHLIHKGERMHLMTLGIYKNWRISVFKRDNYTCQMCGKRGYKLHADHIKPWSLYPELRFAIDNGRTLCVSCHRTTDTWGSRLNNYANTC